MKGVDNRTAGAQHKHARLSGEPPDVQDGIRGTRVAFLGCGSMNEAILSGVLAAGGRNADIVATVRSAERATELAARHGITVMANEDDPCNNKEAVREADVVLLGVKPTRRAPPHPVPEP